MQWKGPRLLEVSVYVMMSLMVVTFSAEVGANASRSTGKYLI
jgi:hypothetical protein